VCLCVLCALMRVCMFVCVLSAFVCVGVNACRCVCGMFMCVFGVFV